MAGDTCVSAQGLATIVGRDKRYEVFGGAHGFYDAGELIRKHQPDVLLIEPFLEDRDGIRWIKDLTTEYPRTRILIVSRQSEQIYAERALQAGAAGYWMKNGSEEELLRAVETVAAGKIYVSPLITSLALERFAHREMLPQSLDMLSDRELAVFALIAAEQSVGRMATTLGISRTPVREALALLADEQLVVIYPQVKTLVAPVRRSLIDEGRFVRSTLECANHAELVKIITRPQLDILASLIAAQRNAAAAGDAEAFFRLDETMHRSMFEFAGRAHVWGMLEGVKRHFDRVRWLLLERVAYHARRAQEEHEAIMDRLVARDAAGLTLAVDHHINAIIGHMQELHDRAPPAYFID